MRWQTPVFAPCALLLLLLPLQLALAAPRPESAPVLVGQAPAQAIHQEHALLPRARRDSAASAAPGAESGAPGAASDAPGAESAAPVAPQTPEPAAAEIIPNPQNTTTLGPVAKAPSNAETSYDDLVFVVPAADLTEDEKTSISQLDAETSEEKKTRKKKKKKEKKIKDKKGKDESKRRENEEKNRLEEEAQRKKNEERQASEQLEETRTRMEKNESSVSPEKSAKPAESLEGSSSEEHSKSSKEAESSEAATAEAAEGQAQPGVAVVAEEPIAAKSERSGLEVSQPGATLSSASPSPSSGSWTPAPQRSPAPGTAPAPGSTQYTMTPAGNVYGQPGQPRQAPTPTMFSVSFTDPGMGRYTYRGSPLVPQVYTAPPANAAASAAPAAPVSRDQILSRYLHDVYQFSDTKELLAKVKSGQPLPAQDYQGVRINFQVTGSDGKPVVSRPDAGPSPYAAPPAPPASPAAPPAPPVPNPYTSLSDGEPAMYTTSARPLYFVTENGRQYPVYATAADGNAALNQRLWLQQQLQLQEQQQQSVLEHLQQMQDRQMQEQQLQRQLFHQQQQPSPAAQPSAQGGQLIGVPVPTAVKSTGLSGKLLQPESSATALITFPGGATVVANQPPSMNLDRYTISPSAAASVSTAPETATAPIYPASGTASSSATTYGGPAASTYSGSAATTYSGSAAAPSYSGPAASTYSGPAAAPYSGPAASTYSGPAAAPYSGPAASTYSGPATPTVVFNNGRMELVIPPMPDALSQLSGVPLTVKHLPLSSPTILQGSSPYILSPPNAPYTASVYVSHKP